MGDRSGPSAKEQQDFPGGTYAGTLERQRSTIRGKSWLGQDLQIEGMAEVENSQVTKRCTYSKRVNQMRKANVHVSHFVNPL